MKLLLENANANVTMHWENRGHQLTMGEVEKSKRMVWKNSSISINNKRSIC